MKIHCCGCGRIVSARLTNGREIHPDSPDTDQYLKCDGCGNYVRCRFVNPHNDKIQGVIPTKEIRAARRVVHDLVWRFARPVSPIEYGGIAGFIA